MKTRKQLIEMGLISDGCTCAPDFDFRSCCDMHDYLYWKGTDRAKADALLRMCIAKKGHPVLAWIYWAAVRVFGQKFYDQKVEKRKAL